MKIITLPWKRGRRSCIVLRTMTLIANTHPGPVSASRQVWTLSLVLLSSHVGDGQAPFLKPRLEGRTRPTVSSSSIDLTPLCPPPHPALIPAGTPTSSPGLSRSSPPPAAPCTNQCIRLCSLAFPRSRAARLGCRRPLVLSKVSLEQGRLVFHVGRHGSQSRNGTVGEGQKAFLLFPASLGFISEAWSE